MLLKLDHSSRCTTQRSDHDQILVWAHPAASNWWHHPSKPSTRKCYEKFSHLCHPHPSHRQAASASPAFSLNFGSFHNCSLLIAHAAFPSAAAGPSSSGPIANSCPAIFLRRDKAHVSRSCTLGMTDIHCHFTPCPGETPSWGLLRCLSDPGTLNSLLHLLLYSMRVPSHTGFNALAPHTQQSAGGSRSRGRHLWPKQLSSVCTT